MACTHDQVQLHATCPCGDNAAATAKVRAEVLRIYEETRSIKSDLEGVFAEQRLDKLEITTLRLSASDLRGQVSQLETEAAELREMRNSIALALGMRIGSEVPDNKTMIRLIKERWGV